MFHWVIKNAHLGKPTLREDYLTTLVYTKYIFDIELLIYSQYQSSENWLPKSQ